MKFKYEGFKQGGTVERGEIEAGSKEDAIQALRDKGVYLQQIVPETETMREVLSRPTNPEEAAFLNTAKDIPVEGSASGVSAFVDDLFETPEKPAPAPKPKEYATEGQVNFSLPKTKAPEMPAMMNQNEGPVNTEVWVKDLQSDLNEVAEVVQEMSNILPLTPKEIMAQIGDKLLYDVACRGLEGLRMYNMRKQSLWNPEVSAKVGEELKKLGLIKTDGKPEGKKKKSKKGSEPIDVTPSPNDPVDPNDPNAPVHNPM